MQKDLGVKTLGPFDHRRVEMRMRKRDGADAAACVYLGDCLVVQQRNAIPDNDSSPWLYEQSTLAYSKYPISADAKKLRRLIVEAVVIFPRKPFERRPF